MSRPALHAWSIYDHPSDYPEKFVVRCWAIFIGTIEPTEAVTTHESLEQARDAVPDGLVCYPRGDTDDSVLVETWLPSSASVIGDLLEVIGGRPNLFSFPPSRADSCRPAANGSFIRSSTPASSQSESRASDSSMTAGATRQPSWRSRRDELWTAQENRLVGTGTRLPAGVDHGDPAQEVVAR